MFLNPKNLTSLFTRLCVYKDYQGNILKLSILYVNPLNAWLSLYNHYEIGSILHINAYKYIEAYANTFSLSKKECTCIFQNRL